MGRHPATGCTGLGLAIARRLSEASRAQLRLEAAPTGSVRASGVLART